MLVKLTFPSCRSLENKEVCRLHVKNKSKYHTMEGILSQIRHVTNLKKGVVLKLYRRVGGSYEELKCDNDVENLFKERCEGDYIRIYVVPCPRLNTKPLNSFFNYCRASELPDILTQPAEQLDISVHDPWLTSPCKLCEREDWSGDRYTCLYCPSIVLCPQCFFTSYHADHPVMVTRDMKPFSRKVLQLAKVIAATVPLQGTFPHPVIKEKTGAEK
ncbi:hypothetical protein P879_06979 [Paragonimus westermani]|uniref:ZZ-type domain-containing protein n=1 Tax=Paragonimus westermani TaxID=34504 RepID=A0A8T0DR72_9TREM|nr:hypothetical protein P879_06979 [Paragonimus westermani]